MDYQNNNYEKKRPNGMATASLILGIVGLATFCCIYTPVICGALAIILALLSRDNGKALSSRANTGLILGIIGVTIGIVLILVFVVQIIGYGSLLNYLDSITTYDLYETNPYTPNLPFL